MNIVIIGGGVAAFEAAVAAAAASIHKVTLCTKEAVLPYRRPALSRMVAEELSDTAFYFKDTAFYQERNIELLLDQEAVAIDRERKIVSFSSGREISYDRLILATGGRAFVPPVDGAENAHVLREYDDLCFIKEKLAAGLRQTVIIGGGVLGLELADSLLAKNCDVTLIEAGSHVLSRNLDDDSAGLVMAHLNSLPGLKIRNNAKVCKITPECVILENGESIRSGLTVFSAGVRSNTALAAAAGLAVDRGILVNEMMQTEDPAIYACGDAAEFAGGCCNLLTTAKSMGHIAGVNASGGNEVFKQEIYPLRMMALGIKLFSAGKLVDAVSETSGDFSNYQRLTRDSAGNLTGVILMGDLKAAVKLQKELHL